jgi:hypothetical protein
VAAAVENSPPVGVARTPDRVVALGTTLAVVVRMRMRFVVAIALVVAAAGPVRADQWVEAHELERSGQILTATGGGLQLVGAGLLIAIVALPPNCAFVLGAPEEGQCAYGGMTRYDDTARELLTSGIIVSVVGDVFAIVGGATWGVAGRRIKRLRASR